MKLAGNIVIYSVFILGVVHLNAQFDPLGMYQSIGHEADRILVTLKTLKIISLAFILLESIEPLVRSDDLKAAGRLYSFARFAALTCLTFAIVLFATTMSDAPYKFACKLIECTDASVLKIFFDMGMSVVPLVVFAFVNIAFMWKLEKGGGLFETARNYFFIVNMPSVVSVVLVCVLAWMMLSEGNGTYVSIFNSGAIALLIFITLCLSFYAESVSEKTR